MPIARVLNVYVACAAGDPNGRNGCIYVTCESGLLGTRESPTLGTEVGETHKHETSNVNNERITKVDLTECLYETLLCIGLTAAELIYERDDVDRTVECVVSDLYNGLASTHEANVLSRCKDANDHCESVDKSAFHA